MTRAVVPIVERSRAVVPQRRKSRRKSPWKRFRKPALRVGAALLVAGMIGGAAFVTRNSGGPAMLLAPVGQMGLSLTGMIGLRVSDLQVEGRHMADRQAVTDAIRIQRDMPILGYDLESARTRLEALPWVETAMVERRLPDTIFVSLTERHPLALWQRNGKFSVIDAKGVEITTDQVGAYSGLPVVVGSDAPPAAENLLLMLDGEPELKRRVTAAVRVGGRRWNLRLDNRVDVKLPELDPAVAWSALAQLERDQKLLEREIVAVDFRQSDRMIVQLTPEAASVLHVDKQVTATADKSHDEKEPNEASAVVKPAAAKPSVAAKPQAVPLQAVKPPVNKPGSTPSTGKQ